MARLTISLLGTIEISLDNEPVTAFEYDKVRALLAYLAVEADRPHRRQSLAALLWPERPEPNARQNLSQALFTLRRAIDDHQTQPSRLIITPHTLQFNSASDYTLDVTTLTGLVAACKVHPHQRLDTCDLCSEKLQQAAALYRGEFLEGFSLPDSPTFEEWSLLNRERLHRLMVETLRHLADYYQRRPDFEEALHYAWRQAELEPWQENSHRRLMRLLALSGQREAALAQYETCRRLLNEEFGIEPAAETTRLVEQIRSGENFSPLPSRPPAPLPSFLAGASPHPSPPTPLVGREHELGRLDKALDLTLTGQGQVVFITGGTGRGKTTLIQGFARQAQARQPDLLVAGGNGNAYIGLGDPYLPFREILSQLTGDVDTRLAVGTINRESAVQLWKMLPLATQALLNVGPDLIETFLPGAALIERVRTFLGPHDSVDWLSRLESLISQKSSEAEARSQQQSDLFKQYTQVLRVLAGHQPLLLLVDDLQWADLASVNLLFHLGRRIGGSRILIVGAYRPDEIIVRPNGKRHPLEALLYEFKDHNGVIEVDLSQSDGWHFVNTFLDTEPNRLDEAFRQTLYRHTGGQPLFTVELLQGMRERGDLIQDQEERWIEGPGLNWTILPPQIEASIAERIGRLAEDLQEILTIASVEGETFTAEVAAHVQAWDEKKTVRSLSDKLGRRHRLVTAQEIRQVNSQHISSYRFRHILFQQYLYRQLDPAERIYLHQAVGTALESLYGDQKGQVALQLARHFQEAGSTAKAIDYLHRAGERAMRMSANDEALAHFNRGLEMLKTLPASPERDRQELILQMALANPLMALKGYGAPEVSRVCARARELCRQVGEPAQLFQVLLLEHSCCDHQGEYLRSYRIAKQALSLAEQVGDPVLRAVAHYMLGIGLVFRGKPTLARSYWEQLGAFWDLQHHRVLTFQYGHDFGVIGASWLGVTLWLLGFPDQARQQSQKALSAARELAHPLTLAHTLWAGGACLHYFCRNAQLTQKFAEACIDLSVQYNLPFWLAAGTIHRGWALGEQGQIEAGLNQIRQGMTDYQATGTRHVRSFLLTVLAEVYGKTGQVEEGLTLLTEALVSAHRSGERLYEAEIHRLKGELLRKTSSERRKVWTESPEACFHRAIKLAHAQQAKSLELRATMSLCRLWQKQGNRKQARQMLEQIYNGFTEGFDTADLIEARVLLEELS